MYYEQTLKNQLSGHVACTQEAKLCPDGSYVGRTGPNCEFICPTATSTLQATSTRDVTAGWQTYRNERYGFEMKYPADFRKIHEEYYAAGVEGWHRPRLRLKFENTDYFLNVFINELGDADLRSESRLYGKGSVIWHDRSVSVTLLEYFDARDGFSGLVDTAGNNEDFLFVSFQCKSSSCDRTPMKNILGTVLSTFRSIKSAPAKAPKDVTRSLFDAVSVHREDAKKVRSDAELFEVETIAIFPLKYVFSNFVSPADDISYVHVSEWFNVPEGRRNYSTDTIEFIIYSNCGGGAQPVEGYCYNEPSGKPEDHSWHLPIRNWNIDIDTVMRIAAENGFCGDISCGEVLVATMGRARHITPLVYASDLKQDLVRLDDGQAVIIVYKNEQYLVIDAANGKVLGRGVYYTPPPPM